MSLAFRQVKVYLRLTLIILVAVAVIMVLWKNRHNEVGIWFFWLIEKDAKVNVVWLMLCTAVGTLIAYFTLHMVWALWREMKKAALDSALTERHQQQERRDRELLEREKRIDAKLKDAISEE